MDEVNKAIRAQIGDLVVNSIILQVSAGEKDRMLAEAARELEMLRAKIKALEERASLE